MVLRRYRFPSSHISHPSHLHTPPHMCTCTFTLPPHMHSHPHTHTPHPHTCTEGPTIQQLSGTIDATAGFQAVLDCTAYGSPAPIVTWLVGDVQLPDVSFPRVSVATNHSLLISNVQTTDALIYYCLASSIVGQTTGTYLLRVNSE